jgi:hypothetical protein
MSEALPSAALPFIHKLPTEVIQAILLLAVHATDHQTRSIRGRPTHAPFFPYTGLYVCRLWYTTLKRTPEAWRQVFVLISPSYNYQATKRRIQLHQALSRCVKPQMHVDVYYDGLELLRACGCTVEEEYKDGTQHCDSCCIRHAFGPSAFWRSMRVIVAPFTSLSLVYILRRLLTCVHLGDISPLRSLRDFSAVAYRAKDTAEVIGSSTALATILGTLKLERLALSNFDSPIEFYDESSEDYTSRALFPYLTTAKPGAIKRIPSLTLLNTTTRGFNAVCGLNLSNLHTFHFTNSNHDDDDDDFLARNFDGDEIGPDLECCIPEACLRAVQCATLDVQCARAAQALLESLENVKVLILDSFSSSIWLNVLAWSSCDHLESVTFCDILHPKDIKSLTQARLPNLQIIRVYGLLEVPQSQSIGDIGVKIEIIKKERRLEDWSYIHAGQFPYPDISMSEVLDRNYTLST